MGLGERLVVDPRSRFNEANNCDSDFLLSVFRLKTYTKLITNIKVISLYKYTLKMLTVRNLKSTASSSSDFVGDSL